MKRIILLALGLFYLSPAHSQGLEGIIVERFYQSDANDEANAFDNGSVVPLPVGSVTYRVFVDMASGYEFSQLFGTDIHPLTINATSDFYNDPSYGVAINPATISANNIKKHTAMIDSWLAIGGVSNGKVGVLKSEDADGSVGNIQGILANNAGGCYGLPITGTGSQDGMMPNSTETYIVPNSLGIGSALEPLDQTAGNSVTISNGAIAALGGVVGPTASNRVLIAQFTVDGEISFQLNLQLIHTQSGTAENYVASNPLTGELTHPTLSYNSNIAPTVSISSPTNNELIGVGPNTVVASALDVQGSIASVEFFVDGNSIGVDTSFPYEVVYNATTGSHTISAIATDSDCLTGSSQIISVNVSSSQAPVITINAPSVAVAGSLVSITANASDPDGSIIGVEFFVNGSLIGSDNSAPYSVNWLAALGVNQEITAVATDNSGISTTSAIHFIDVNPNIAPTVSIVSPLSTDDFTSPEVVVIVADASDSDGSVVSVEFFVNDQSVGLDSSAPFSVNWISIAGNAEITAVATDSNGASTTSLSVNITVLDPSTEPYAFSSITETCDIAEFCLPLTASAAFPLSGVIGYNIVVNFDETKLETDGTVDVSDDLIASDYVDVDVTSIQPGQVQVMLSLNSGAPVGAQFQGYGELFCLHLTRMPGFAVNDSTEITIVSVVESYATGTATVQGNSGMIYSVGNNILSGHVLNAFTNEALVFFETDESSAVPMSVYGYDGLQIANPDNPALVGNDGSFSHNLEFGTDILIERDLQNTSSIQSVVNAADVARAKAIINGELIPTVFELIALDVNLDGVISAGDISQMNQRITLSLGEYEQLWNYNGSDVSNGQPSHDWLFLNNALLDNPAFSISTTYPNDDLIGYSLNRVPSIPAYISTGASNFNPESTICQEWPDENVLAILLGDVNGSYGSSLELFQDSLIMDISQAVYTEVDLSSFIEIPVRLSIESNDLSSADLRLKFNSNKLSLDTVFPSSADLELAYHLNVADEYLRISSHLISQNNLIDGDVVFWLRFMLLDDCAPIYSTDLSSHSAWLNGKKARTDVLDGSVLPDPIQVISPTPYCVGSPIDFSYSDQIDGQVIDTYSWQFGDGSSAQGQNVSAIITAPGAVSILLSLTTITGCTYQVASEIQMFSSPQPSFSYTWNPDNLEVSFDNSSSIGAGSIVEYSWDFGDGSFSSDSDPIHAYSSQGTYNVSLTAVSAQGCSSSITIPVNLTVWVNEVNGNDVLVYPNPFADNVNIESEGIFAFQVSDQMGRIVLDGKDLMSTNPLRINTHDWQAGIYNLMIYGNKGPKTMRLVKVN